MTNLNETKAELSCLAEWDNFIITTRSLVTDGESSNVIKEHCDNYLVNYPDNVEDVMEVLYNTLKLPETTETQFKTVEQLLAQF